MIDSSKGANDGIAGEPATQTSAQDTIAKARKSIQRVLDCQAFVLSLATQGVLHLFS